jgi:hypothetical protein
MAVRKKAGPTLDTVQQYADHRGVSRQAVYKAISEGKIPFQNGLIDRDLADQQWAENSARGAAADDEGPEPSGRPTLNKAQTLLALRRARKLELEILKDEGTLRREAELAAAEQARVVTEALESFPARLTPRIAPGAARAEYLRIEKVIREECRRLAQEISTGSSS